MLTLRYNEPVFILMLRGRVGCLRLRSTMAVNVLRFPDFMTTAQDGGKVVQPYAPATFTPRKYNWYSFLLEAESTPGP